jgi:hypothetical protein
MHHLQQVLTLSRVQHRPHSTSAPKTLGFPQMVSFLQSSETEMVIILFMVVNTENSATIGPWDTDGDETIYEEDEEVYDAQYEASGSVDSIDDMDYLRYAHVNK